MKDHERFKELAADGVVPVREAELYEESAKLKRNSMKMAAETLSMLRTGMGPERIEAAKANVKEPRPHYSKQRFWSATKIFYSPAAGVIIPRITRSEM